MMREMASRDLYYLLRYVLSTSEWKDESKSRSFWDHPWLLARCREIQFDSEDTLNIWSRAHGKSTIATFGFSILSMIQNPNITIGIFSVTKDVADDFLGQVKYELESNQLLQSLFPDRFYKHPQKEAQRWTVEKGFTIKRPLNLKDATIRGFGLLDTSFTGRRISHFIYDDAVNEQNVNTPDMVEKTNERWELSLNVGMPGCKRYYVGTFYAYGDTYHHMGERGIQIRLHPCYEIDQEKSSVDPKTGLPIELVHLRNKPVLFSKAYLEDLEKQAGPTTFGVQNLCDPSAGAVSGFKQEWLRFYQGTVNNIVRNANVIITVDPAADKKKGSSKTALVVWALGKDKNYFVLDMVVDRLNLHERTEVLFDLVAQWQPLEVRYEKYSMQSDIEHIQYVQSQRAFFFDIKEVGGSLHKDDRISRLIPLFAAGRIYLPQQLHYQTREGEMVDLINQFIKEEYSHFPNTLQKDTLDSMSRIAERDMPLPWPRPQHYGRRADSFLAEMRKGDAEEEGTWASA
jgi:predicted phage terminase large subunit-like protein